ncbi:MAG: prepilin-type N-terminal cleavage/methylation domain-containing protein [Methylacidiphilales bacterium]|nr:prepilin-type N-terminal cleavage/methylation domain-containing protein [Candidatus Methylacidiphilales bacterium]
MKTIRSQKETLSNGFTLVELLTAITILSIILLALGAAMGFVSRLWLNGVGTVDNFTKARVIMNLLDRDIQMMVMRPDMAAFVDSNGAAACAFYTNIQGDQGTATPDTRTISLVQYVLNPTTGSSDAALTTLGRINYGMNFTANGVTPQLLQSVVAPSPTPTPALPPPPSATKDTDNIASGVLMFQWQFVDGTGAILTPPYTPNTPTSLPANVPFYYDYTTPSAPYNPHVVVISLLVISNAAYTIAEQTGKMSQITGIFSGTPPINGTTPETYSQYWNSILQNPPSTFTSLPAQVRDGIKVFERHVPLPVAVTSS